MFFSTELTGLLKTVATSLNVDEERDNMQDGGVKKEKRKQVIILIIVQYYIEHCSLWAIEAWHTNKLLPNN